MWTKTKPLRRAGAVRNVEDYFVAGGGVAGAVCGGAVAGVAGLLGVPWKTELPTPLDLFEALMESVKDVSMKTMTAAVVARERADAAPRGPKVLWLPVPPNAPARSALLPLCSSTTIMRKMHTITCITVKAIRMKSIFLVG